MIFIELNRMPKNCEECAFCLKINKLAVYCMATRFQIKYDETDLRDGMCPIHDLELAPVVHGYWRNRYFHPIYASGCGECSICGKDNPCTNYCPYCGAKMDESEDSDNA